MAAIRTFLRRLAGRPDPRDRNPVSGRDETLRLLAEKSGDVIFRFGPDGKARYISPSVERLFGCTPKEIYAMGGTVVSNGFVHAEDLPLVRLRRRDEQEEVDRAEQEHRIGHIMFEQPDHRPRTPPRTAGAVGAVLDCVSISDTASSVG